MTERPGRFLLAVIDAGGTLPPALGVARELVRRGHTVEVLGDPTTERSARAAGCGFTSWQRAPHLDSVAEQSALLKRSRMNCSTRSSLQMVFLCSGSTRNADQRNGI